jgi:Na+/proline symporter
MRIAGIALIVLGLVALLFGGLPYRETENVAELGPIKMQVTEKKKLTIPPLVSGLAILGGAALLFGARKRQA